MDTRMPGTEIRHKQPERKKTWKGGQMQVITVTK